MSKSYRNKPQNERDIVVKKAERGNKHHLQAYRREKFSINDYEEDMV